MADTIEVLQAENEQLRKQFDVIKNTLTAKTYNLGEKFHTTIVEHLAHALDADYTFVGKLRNHSIDTIALWGNGQILPNFNYELQDTPCDNVVGNTVCSYSKNICELYPKDVLLQDMGVEGYVGVPLFNTRQEPMGILVALYCKPVKDVELAESTLLVFANRAAAEIEHQQIYAHIEEKTRELEIAKEKAEESDKLKSAFLSNLSHEVRTPLNGIIGFIELLKDSKEIPQTTKLEYMNNITYCSHQLLGIISDLVDIAKIESGTFATNKTVCKLSDILASVREKAIVFKRELLKSNLKISFYNNTEIENINTDWKRLQQVLEHLVQNAIKFTNSGKVEVVAEESDGEIFLFVRDTGIGIEEDNIEFIFDSFRQVNNDGFTDGNGLGLTIGKAIIEMLGGTLTVASEFGKGSKFQVCFSKESIVVNEDFIEEVNQRHIISQKLHVLIAEDEDLNYRFLEEMFKGSNFTLTRAKNGIDAVNIFKAETFDLVLMDLKMPKMDGFTALKQVRKVSDTVPVIAVTAYAQAEDRVKVAQSGFDGYITKPIDKNKLLMEIERFRK